MRRSDLLSVAPGNCIHGVQYDAGSTVQPWGLTTGSLPLTNLSRSLALAQEIGCLAADIPTKQELPTVIDAASRLPFAE